MAGGGGTPAGGGAVAAGGTSGAPATTRHTAAVGAIRQHFGSGM